MRRLLAILALLLFSVAVRAQGEPEAYVFSPVVEQGELEIDSKAGIARDRDGRSYWGASVGLSYGVTSWWAAEFTAKWRRDVGEHAGYDAWEWENRFQLLESGPYVLGFLAELERPDDSSEGWEFNYGPLFQAEPTLGGVPLRINFNTLFQRRWQADEPAPITLQLQWQLRTLHGEDAIDVGLQGFDHLGPWDDWAPKSRQSHVLGPALFGTLELGGSDIRWEIAALFGTGGGAPKTTLRTQAEIEF